MLGSGSACRFLSLAALLALYATPGRAQAPPPPALPLDSAQVLQILREAAAAFRQSSEALRANDRFRGHLQELFEAWGGSWDAESVPRPPTPEEVIDSLVAAGRIDAALAHAERAAPSWHPHRFVLTVLDGLAARGRVDEALALADSMGLASRGIYAVLESEAPDTLGWRWKVDRIARFIRDETADRGSANGNWGVLNYYLAQHDFAAAWARAGEWEPDSVTAWRLDILDLAYEQGLPTADSLFLDTYERVRRVTDPEIRDRQLAHLGHLCEEEQASVCDGLEFADDPRARRRASRYELERALAAGRFSEGEEPGRELRALVSAVDYAVVVAKGLSRAHWACIRDAGCGRAYDSVLTVTLPGLDRIASESEGPSADELNAALAGLWAGRDLARAAAAIDRIDSSEARARGLHAFAVAALQWDREAAFQAFRDLGHAGGTWLEGHYLHFMSWGDTVRAEEVIGLMNRGVARMGARLAWAGRVQKSGRWEEARRLAVAALDEWNPSVETLAGSRGQFNFFWRMETYDDVIVWARSRPDPDDRAVALAAAIGTLPRPRDR